MSNRQIAKSCHIARSTVADYLSRLDAVGLSWPLPPDLDEEHLDIRLFRRPELRGRDTPRPLPDWAVIHKDLRRKAVTLNLLWHEYRETFPDGYGYSQFCVLHRSWARKLDVSMHQTHRAGEKLFVDYAGMTMPVNDPATGEVHNAQIFVAALGASQYLHAEATRTQRLPDWIGSHARTFEHLGGVTEIVVVDNLKSGVARACRYEPDINPTYANMADYYGIAVIPARPRKPKDKAKAESGVQIVEREVLAPLRDRTFFSLGELNRAIGERLAAVNTRPFQKQDASRRHLFETLDQPALKALPSRRYQYGEFFRPRVNIDYRIDVLRHFYSVPYTMKGQKVEARLTARMLEVLHRGKRVASHMRDDRQGRHTTDPSHMPKAHWEHLEWSPSRIIHWAGKIGPHCALEAEDIIGSRAHPEQGYRACLGLMRLSKSYEARRVDAACRRALAMEVCMEDIDCRAKRGLKRATMESLRGGEWIGSHQNVILTGPTGTGKTYLACALGANACRAGYRVEYFVAAKLFRELRGALAEGSYMRLAGRLAANDLLILDDWGMETLKASEYRDLLEILDDRQGKGATLITSQFPVDLWHDTISNPTVADAILDRLVHNAHKIEMDGESTRKNQGRRSLNNMAHGTFVPGLSRPAKKKRGEKKNVAPQRGSDGAGRPMDS